MDGSVLVSLAKGSRIRSGGREWLVKRDLTLDTIIAEDVETGETARIRVDSIEANAPAGAASPPPALEAIPEAEWDIAQARFKAIAPVVDRPGRTRADVEAIAAEAGVTPATVYGWLKRFEASLHVSSLLPRKAGRRKGAKQLAPDMEEVIKQFIEVELLTDQKKTAHDVIEAVKEHCDRHGLTAPGENTIRRRIGEIDLGHKLRRRGMRDQARSLEPLRGRFPETTHPFQVLQMDHTPADMEVVTDDRLEALGRPWITLLIDCFSRMVVGYHLDMERPSTFTAGACVAMSVLPKGEVLAALELPGEWPVWGLPGKVLCDNAGEFDGNTIKRACHEHGIVLEFRPVATPHYGGYIERMCGTVNRKTHKLPGTTFSNPVERGKYDPSKKAVLTLDEFEYWLVNFIVNEYNQGKHSGIGMAPIAKFRDAILGTRKTPGRGLPDLVPNPERLRIDFLPYEMATVQRYGIQWDHERYDAPVLNKWRQSKEPGTKVGRKFTVRRDPRKNSPIWFHDPDANIYLPIPYADVTKQVVSLWEHRQSLREMKAAGERIDHHTVDAARKRGKDLVTAAQAKTKAARKAEHRRKARERAVAQRPGDPLQAKTPKPVPAPVLFEHAEPEDVGLPTIIDDTAYD